MSNMFLTADTIISKIALIIAIAVPIFTVCFIMVKEGKHILDNLEPEPKKPIKTNDELADNIARLEAKQQQLRRDSDETMGLFLLTIGILSGAMCLIPIIMIIKG